MKSELEQVPIPDEHEAMERTWEVVSRAYMDYLPRPRRRRLRLIPALAAACACALVAIAVSPAGSDLVHSLREAVGLKNAAPALTQLPAAGELLVSSAEGPWIVQPDGSKRLLGDYSQASWSPHGLYVAVIQGHELLAVDPHGTVAWTITRPGTLSLPRWAPDGYRIAYLDDSTLRIVVGNGSGDRPFAAAVAPVAPVWQPSLTHQHVLAFISKHGQLKLYDVDTNKPLARRRLPLHPLQLLWSSDGQRLVALSAHTISIFGRDGNPLRSIHLTNEAVTAAFEPGSHQLAVILSGSRDDAVTFNIDQPASAPQQIFTGAGRFSGLAWSPNGQWLLLAWRSADQWLFVRTAPQQQLSAVSKIAAQFDPGQAHASFPTLEGWCCSQ